MAAVVSAGPFDQGSQAGSSASGTFGPGASWRGLSIIDSPRYRELDRRQTYFDCTQHDFKRFDFDGRLITPGQGAGVSQPLISSERAAFYVPLRQRRPNSPYRLPRVIVRSFTSLVFGEGRFPTVRVLGDFASQDYAQALARATRLPAKMIRARDLGGATGTVGLSWAYIEGKPRILVHNAKGLHVHSWEDREELVPRHVTEAFIYPQDEWDPGKKRFVKAFYWYRRDWTQNEDIVFLPLRFQTGVDPSLLWQPDTKKSVTHNDGVCHLSWIQNLPTDDIDGTPDYDGLYENFDTLDLILSTIVRGATLNLDPTLVLKMDRDLVERVGVRKGSDNALAVGANGDAQYLELAGSSVDAGVKLFNEKRRAILEVAQCVLPDPNDVAARGTSSVALKMMYAPMLAQGAQLREQYGTGMARALEPMLVVARKASQSTVIIYDADDEAQINPIEAQQEISLPPRVVQSPKLDDDGVPTGELESSKVPRDPGEGGELDFEWPPWFPPTPTDQQATITSMTLAVGQGVAVLSQQTAVEFVANSLGRDPADEWARTQQAQASNEAKQEQMFSDATGDMGGKVKHTMQLPGGHTMTRSAGGQPPPDEGDGDDAPSESGESASESQEKPPKDGEE